MHGLKAKGLKKGSVSQWATVAIGLAATAPAYSLAGALGYGAASCGYQLPIVFILSVIPMFFVALSYKYLTAAAPDAGTIFTWGTKAIGPRVGWFGGWALLLSSILAGVTATQITVISVAVILKIDDPPIWFHLGVATLFIFSTTYLTAMGARESSRTTLILAIAQYGILILLAVFLFVRIFQGQVADAAESFSWAWFNPFEIPSFDVFLKGSMIALFIFWGFDASLAMSEETDGDSEQAGRSGVIAMSITILTYVLFSIAALAYAGIDTNDVSSLTHEKNIDSSITVLAIDMFGVHGALVAAVIICISAFSATMSTIMPSARMALAMATYRAIPHYFASVDKQTQTPKFATWMIGLMTLIIYSALSLMSESIIEDAILSVSIAVCTFYIVASSSCAFYFYRTALSHWHTALTQVIFPATAAVVLMVVAALQVWRMMAPDYGSSGSIAGVGTVFVVGVVTLLCGAILMLLWNLFEPRFFRGETLPLERAHMVSDRTDRYIASNSIVTVKNRC